MAVTDTAHDAAKITRFFGLSTDTKPAQAMIDATFLEVDTGRGFVYTGNVWVRSEKTTVEQAAAVIVEKVPVTDELLSGILVQLKIGNAHLALITDEEELDVPGN